MQPTVAKTTIQDIARALHVTPSTVSRALNGHQAISGSTRQAVQKMAKKLNYHPNKIASSLRLGKSKIIGVIIPSAEINFFGSVVHGVEKVASKNGYNVIIYQSNEQSDVEKKGVTTLLHSRVDGILASISKDSTTLHHFKEIKRRGVPLVLFDRVNDSLQVPSVVVDDFKGAYKATEHLIQQGCKRIVHIAGPQHISIFKERLKGYQKALEDFDLPFQDACVKYGSISIKSGHKCMMQLLAQKEKPDGIFAVEDFTALGAMQALKKAGIKVPEHVALIGFANEAFGEYITPSLSTVDQQTIKMGEKAASLFFELSQQDSFYTTKPSKIVLDPVLIYRESSLRKNVSNSF